MQFENKGLLIGIWIFVPNVAIEWVVLLLHIWEVPASTLGPEIGCGFSQSLQAYAGVISVIRPPSPQHLFKFIIYSR
jgi:hypothetical protein